jgi:hypothetical protein
MARTFMTLVPTDHAVSRQIVQCWRGGTFSGGVDEARDVALPAAFCSQRISASVTSRSSSDFLVFRVQRGVSSWTFRPLPVVGQRTEPLAITPNS